MTPQTKSANMLATEAAWLVSVWGDPLPSFVRTRPSFSPCSSFVKTALYVLAAVPIPGQDLERTSSPD